MHRSAMRRMEWFINNYIPNDTKVRILDVGSYDVNGCYRTLLADKMAEYVGLDMAAGPNVDFVPADPYDWKELDDNAFDFVISGNAFEHIEYPWITIKEIYRVLKDGGIACILAPNSLGEHRYPVDCYRYYSDGFAALAKWAGFIIINITVSGVPSSNAPKEWYYEGANDTMMIIGKGVTEEYAKTLPTLNREIRYSLATWFERQYHFLANILNDPSPADTMRNFFESNHISTVVIYGYGRMGRIIHKFLKEINPDRVYLMDKNWDSIKDENIIKPGSDLNEPKTVCIVNTVFSGEVYFELGEMYPDSMVIMADEIYAVFDNNNL